ncbi:hypothetical protein OIV83_002357 [Microbotryomycetes sp. JL201]|nr:hypothetical protein OIV83_002357 [Microbotryomycetes sp. JL201]
MASDTASTSTKRPRQQTLMDSFQEYRAELDEHHDRRERIIKQSRDITAMSKKAIFAAHRITNTDRKTVVREVENKLKDLRAMFARLQPDVAGENFWRRARNHMNGAFHLAYKNMLLEAIIFYQYLTHNKIMSLQEAQVSLQEVTSTTGETESMTLSEPVRITVSDYLGGIADVTGEMMRLAIGSVGKSLLASTSGDSEAADFSIEGIGRTVRDIKGEMEPLVPMQYWLDKKMSVMDASLSKIEIASYNLRIRGAEYAGSPAMLAAIAGREVGGGDRPE